MIDAIKKFFESKILPEPAGGEHALALACAALLYEVARMDFHVHDKELARLQQLLQIKFQLSPAETADLIAATQRQAEDTHSYYDFTRLINQRFSYERKIDLIEMMWQIALVDQTIDKYEEHLIRKVADLLYVSHVDFIQAKHRAQQ